MTKYLTVLAGSFALLLSSCAVVHNDNLEYGVVEQGRKSIAFQATLFDYGMRVDVGVTPITPNNSSEQTEE